MRDLQVSVTRFSRALASDRRQGLQGWVAITLSGVLRIDGIAIRRKADGGVAVFFPERVDARGRRHAVVWPIAPWARREIERQVLAQLSERAGRLQKVVAP